METTDSTIYTVSSGLGWSTQQGTQCNGGLQLEITGGTDFTDDDLFALQQALVAAFPEAWGVTIEDFSVSKFGQQSTSYVTNATATPPTFS
jgi:hypothetical protein